MHNKHKNMRSRNNMQVMYMHGLTQGVLTLDLDPNLLYNPSGTRLCAWNELKEAAT